MNKEELSREIESMQKNKIRNHLKKRVSTEPQNSNDRFFKSIISRRSDQRSKRQSRSHEHDSQGKIKKEAQISNRKQGNLISYQSNGIQKSKIQKVRSQIANSNASDRDIQIELHSRKGEQTNMKNRQASVGVNMGDREKDELLEKLAIKNKKLAQHITELQEVLNLNKKFHSQSIKRETNLQQLYFSSTTKQSIEKELANAYIIIKRMEEEISLLKELDGRKQLKKEKKLRESLQQVTKVRNDLMIRSEMIKKEVNKKEELINNHKNGKGLRERVAKLILQAEIFRQKQKQMRVNENLAKQKIMKQQQYIRRLQKQLVENGVSRQSIQEIMNKTLYRDKYESIKQKVITQEITKEEPERDYKKMTHQIKVLSKSTKEQEKTIQDLIKQAKVVNQNYAHSEQNSKRLDEEIQKVNERIKQTRKIIDPLSLIPKKLPLKEPSLEDQKSQHREHLRQMRKKFYEKKTKNYLKSLDSLQDAQNQFTYSKQLLQNEPINDEVSIREEIKDSQQEGRVEVYGATDRLGTRFSDKKISDNIGFSNCFLTGLTALIGQNGVIVGIKSQYNYKNESNLHRYIPKVNAKQYLLKKKTLSQVKEEFFCVEQQYIVSIETTFSEQGFLVNLTVITNLNRYHKYGSVLQISIKNSNSQIGEGQKKKQVKSYDIAMGQDLRPIYIFGCISKQGICQFGARVFSQQIECQISQQEIQ